MFDWGKLFAREGRRRRRADDTDTYADSKLPQGHGLEDEYEELIATQCMRWGISHTCLSVEVRQIGQGPDGRGVYWGLLRLVRWERNSALRLLLGLPPLEAKIRKILRGMWMSEVSHFGGLWLHASEQLQATPAAAELRQLLLEVAPRQSPPDSGMDDPVTAV